MKLLRRTGVETLILYAVVFVLLGVSLAKDRGRTKAALLKGLKAVEGILPQFIAVAVFVAVILSVFSPETISKLIGGNSGVWGILVSSLVGAVTLIPGFVAFPAASELLKNGAGVYQIAAFVSSLMMVGVVTLPMEMKFFGKRAALARNLLAFAFSIVAALFVGWAVSL